MLYKVHVDRLGYLELSTSTLKAYVACTCTQYVYIAELFWAKKSLFWTEIRLYLASRMFRVSPCAMEKSENLVENFLL